MRVNFYNLNKTDIFLIAFKGTKEGLFESEPDYFSYSNETHISADEYIQKRLLAFVKSDGLYVIPPVHISMILRESENKQGLARMVSKLKPQVLEKINWLELSELVYDNEPDYDEFDTNYAFLNSLDSNTLSKLANPTKLLFSHDFHFEQLGKSLNSARVQYGSKIAQIFLKAQKIDDNEYKNVYRYCDTDGNLLSKDTVLFDSKKNVLLKESETITNENGQKVSSRVIQDYRSKKTHLVNSNVATISIKRLIPNFEVTYSNSSTIYRYNSAVKGVSNVFEIADGCEPQNIVYASKKDGKIQIRKKVTSFEGVTTIFKLDSNEDGSRKLNYTITDKDGNTLLDKKSSVEKISDNTYRSTVNDKSYLATINENMLTIEDETKGTSYDFNLDKYIDTKNEDLKSFILKLEAPQIIKLFKNTTGVHQSLWHMSHFNNFESFDIFTDLNIFNICHELAHAVDFGNGHVGHIGAQLSVKKEFTDTFKKEYEIFMKNATVTQRDYLRRSPKDDIVSEAFAESNGLLNYYQSQEEVSARAETFQQYFPRTIAAAYNLLNK